MTLHPNTEVIARRMGEAAVLVHLHTNRIYELNHTGARIWELVAAGLDRATIHHQLRREFNVDEDRLVRDVEALVSRLASEGLLEPDAG